MSQWTFGQSSRKVDAIQFHNNFKKITNWVLTRGDFDITEIFRILNDGDYLIYENGKLFSIEKKFFEKHYEIDGTH